MTIRDKINKLEVLEQIIDLIQSLEEGYRNDVARYRNRALTEEADVYWDELATISEAKADHCHSYKVMLMDTEIK